MTEPLKTSPNRREFFRVDFTVPLEFKSYLVPQAEKFGTVSELSSGATQNLSQSGILFETTENPPQLSSILWMNLDIRTLNICREIETRALIFQNGLLGRVVRVEENPAKDHAFDVGVCFLTQDQTSSREVQVILADLSKSKS